MTEADAATKAPESDAHEEEAGVHAPTPASQSAGEHCVSDRPTPSGQSSTGEIVKLNEVDCYISKPADYPHTPSRLLLLLTGGTGLKSVNNQIQADKFAGEGFLVVMPDLFDGDPAPNSATIRDEDAVAETSFLDRVKLRAVETAKSFLIDMWLARHTEEKVMPILHQVIDACHDKYADSIATGGGIYAVGYCIGGRYVLLLGSERTGLAGWGQKSADEEAGEIKKGPLIKVGALAHGASVIPDDFSGLKVPVSLVCVENDPLFPDEVRTAGEDAMSNAGLEHAVTIYPGVPHGFAVVGEYQDPSIKEAQATANDQLVKWLTAH